MRCLLERFTSNVATIKEAQDIDHLRLDELMSSLQTYEVNLNITKKEKKLAFQNKAQGVDDCCNNEDDMAYLTKKLKKIVEQEKDKLQQENSYLF